MNTPAFSVVLLSGGIGLRIGGATPKQYLPLNHKPIALHSFELFLSIEEVQEVVVVCHQEYETLFLTAAKDKRAILSFAQPGARRQDSLFNGIQRLDNNPLVCIHDAARPFIEVKDIRNVVEAANIWNAAALGTRSKSTIKVCDTTQMVIETPCRDQLWEAQTPQVIRHQLLKEGFSYINQHQLTVTDDVSLVEYIGKPVKIIEGSYNNTKITTPEDLLFTAHSPLQTNRSI